MALAMVQLGKQESEAGEICASFHPSLHASLSPYLGLTLKAPKENLVTILTQKTEAHICYPLYWLPVEVPAARERRAEGRLRERESRIATVRS